MNIYARLIVDLKATDKMVNEEDLILEAELFEFQDALEAFIEESKPKNLTVVLHESDSIL